MFLTFKRTICIGTILKRTLTTDHTTNQELTEVLKKINDLRQIIFKKREMKRSLSELGPKQPINIQILSTGYLNDSKSFLIASNDRSYMINCGESMSRFMNSERKNILKIEHLFLTRVNWNTLGGLYSTTFDKKSLKMHSAFNFKNEFKNAKCIFDRTCQMSQHDYNKSFEFEDDIIKVTPIHQSIEESSYLFTVKQTVPKILTHKLNEYNLKPGPWIKDIQNGKDYTSRDGQLIKASELVDNISCEEKQILVIDFINESTFQNTLIHKIDQLQLNNKKAFILHLSDISLQKTESYKNWMNNLNDCVHIVFDESKPTIDILRLYELQVQLHLVNESLFPLLQLEKNLTECEYNNRQLILAKTNMIINIRPCFEIDCEKVIDKIDYKNFKLSNSLYNYLEMKNSINDSDSETNNILNEFKHKLENYQEKETQYSQSLNNGIYPKVLLLGTSSAVATVYRNVSSTLFLINESKYFLLDCGESTWIQMKRFFPSNSFNNEICKVKAVFISHAHYDHHNGFLIYSK
jgi:ribonuclease BN (tRNA processing enzyme)